MSDILLSDLTNSTNASNGTGVFDVLINSIELRIQNQFAQQRITSDDYAMVYLGAIQSTLAESIKFLLSEQQAGLEADLLAQKILTEVQSTALTREKAESENKNNEAGGVIDKQKTKLVSEDDLLSQKTLTEEKQTAKVSRESILLTQKYYTEYAQIANEFPYTNPETGGSLGTHVVTGTIGKKNELFQAQTDGFARDAEQKMAKIMVDTWNVAKTADPTGVSGNVSNKLTDNDIGQVISKAKAGIGT